MTVSATTRKAGPFSGNGSTTVFPFVFKVFTSSDITVVRADASGVETTLVLNSDYSVSLNSDQTASPGGNVTLSSALATGYSLSITGNLAYSQATQLPTGGAYNAQNVEAAFDRVTMLTQQLLEQVSRAVKVSVTSGIDPSTYVSTLAAAVSSAASSAASAQASLNTFQGQYYGSRATDPTLDPLGAAMTAGDLYFNTVTARMRVYTGTVWSDTGTALPVTINTQRFSGNASTTVFTLTNPPAFQNAAEVFISGVRQVPGVDYTVTGTTLNTLTFTTAPPTGTNNIFVQTLSSYAGGVPNDGSVTTTKIADANITPAKLANSGNELGMRNRIINGAMTIDQRYGGGAISAATLAAAGFTVDRFGFQGSQSAKFAAQQNSGGVTPPAGFNNYLGLVTATAFTVGASDFFSVFHKVEGVNVADFGWGTANAQPATLQFKVYSSLTGTFGGVVQNSASNRSYPFTYSVPVANTWTTVSIMIPGDTSGTWLKDTNNGLYIQWGLGVGSTYSGAAGAWAGANYVSATGAVSVVGTLSATFYITGVQLEKGSTATPFEFRPYGTELALCQRYYQQWASAQFFGAGVFQSATVAFVASPLGAYMRTAPTVSTTLSGLQLIGSTNFVPSAVAAIYGVGNQTVGFNFTVSGATPGQGIAAYTNTATFSLSAEL